MFVCLSLLFMLFFCTILWVTRNKFDHSNIYVYNILNFLSVILVVTVLVFVLNVYIFL